MTPTADTPPQRFRWKPKGAEDWEHGVCLYLKPFGIWDATTFGLVVGRTFRTDPWEVMHKVVGDAAVFEWIDNDMGWRGFEGGK